MWSCDIVFLGGNFSRKIFMIFKKKIFFSKIKKHKKTKIMIGNLTKSQ